MIEATLYQLREVGVRVALEADGDAEAMLFGEGPGRFVLAGSAEAIARIVDEADGKGVPAAVIGVAGGDEIEIVAGATAVELALDRAVRAWESLRERVAGVAGAA